MIESKIQISGRLDLKSSCSTAGHREAAPQDSRGHHAEELMRLSGRLQASLRYGQVSEILERDAGIYLRTILDRCLQIHELIYEVYIRYSVQTALAM